VLTCLVCVFCVKSLSCNFERQFYNFRRIFSRNFSDGTDCPVYFMLNTTQSCKVRENREEGASNPDVCHAQNRNPAAQCIILFASAILCLSCTTLSYKKICGLGLLVIVAPQPFNTSVICVRNRSRQSCMWSKEVDCF
jgi:hypothetical protein